MALLAETARRVRAAGFEIGNVSIQVIGVPPEDRPASREAQQVLSEAVGAPVTVSGTTTDGLGLTGRGEGLAGIAVALVYDGAGRLSSPRCPATAAPDQSAADGYVQRAQLLAELGRYDEAAGELAYAVGPSARMTLDALTMLARVHLAADRPAEALTAADTAVAAAPEALPPLVARGMALADLERYTEAAATADRILALGPADAYAQRSAAAILAARATVSRR